MSSEKSVSESSVASDGSPVTFGNLLEWQRANMPELEGITYGECSLEEASKRTGLPVSFFVGKSDESDSSPGMTGESAVVVFHHAVETITNAGGQRVVVCSHCGKEFSASGGKALNDELTNPMHDCVSTHFASTVPAEKREKFLARLPG